MRWEKGSSKCQGRNGLMVALVGLTSQKMQSCNAFGLNIHPSIHPRVKAAPNLLSMAQQSESESEISGKSKEIRPVGYQ
jgi:hypothetical protein